MRTGMMMAGLVLAALHAPAAATIVIDQDNLVDVAGLTSPGDSIGGAPVGRLTSFNFGSIYYKAIQTVTAGKSGVLAGVDLQVFRTNFGTFKLHIIDGAVTSDAGPFVGSFALPTLTQPDVLAGGISFIDLSSLNYTVSPGQQFSILLELESTVGLLTWVTFGNEGGVQTALNYAGGGAFLSTNGSSFFALTNPLQSDFAFRTYVESAVPEPGVWAMLIMGFGLTGAVARRRRAVLGA